MKDLILIGSGGCMQELLYQIENLNKVEPAWNVMGFVDREKTENTECPYLGDDDWLLSYNKSVSVCLSVQEPALRRKLFELYRKNPRLEFPVIRMLDTYVADSTSIGDGTILCENTRITNHGTVGKCCFLNIGAQIHHEAKIADFVTIAPNATIAGNVTIQDGSYIGMGANVIQGITIEKNAVIGAGAAVVRDIPENATAVGVPARVIKRK